EPRWADALDDGAVAEHRAIVRSGVDGEKLLAEHALTGHEPARVVVDCVLVATLELGARANRGLWLLRFGVEHATAKLEFADTSDAHPRNADRSARLQAARILKGDVD